MRIIVMFDLPTGDSFERKRCAAFRKFLIRDGYHMEQFSVYSRIAMTRESVATHIARLKCHLPPTGDITVLQMTERQFEDRLVLRSTVGERPVEQSAQLTLVF